MQFAYISDIHIEFVAKNHVLIGMRPVNSVERVAQIFLNDLMHFKAVTSPLDGIVIAGDISHCREDTINFLSIVAKEIRGIGFKVPIIWVAGNHDIWGFSSSFNKGITGRFTVDQCRGYDAEEKWLHQQSNSIDGVRMLYCGDEIKMSKDGENLTIIGDLGYSGYNPMFCSQQFIYRNALTEMDEEIERTDKWVNFYKEKLKTASDKNKLLVITHNPISDWMGTHCPDESGNVFYINGHTHGYGGLHTTYTYRDDAQNGYDKENFVFKLLNTLSDDDM